MSVFNNSLTSKIIKRSRGSTGGSGPSKNQNIILLLAVSVALIMTGFGIIMPVFAHRLEDFGSGVAEMGFMIMGFALTQFALSPILGSLADRIGRRPIILLALGGFAAVNLGFLFAPNTNILLVLRCLEGGITAGLLPAAQATVGDIIPADRRAKGIGTIMAGYGVGFVLGPVIGGLLYDMWGYVAPFITSFAMGLIALVFAWIMVPETYVNRTPVQNKLKSHPSGKRVSVLDSLPKPLATFTILVLVSFVLTFAFAFIEPALVFYVYNELNFSTTQFGLLAGIYGLAMVLGQVVFGGLSDKYGRKPVIVLGLIISSVFFVGMVFFTGFATLFAVAAIGGLGSAIATAATSAYVLDISNEQHRSRIMGVRSSFVALGGAIAPLLTALVSGRITYQSMFLISAAIGVIVAIVALFILKTGRQSSIDSEAATSPEAIPEEVTPVPVLIRTERD